MSQRFYSDVPVAADSTVLSGPEAHHLLHVMRAKPGDRVTLFDDSGAEFRAEVVTLGRSEATLAVLSREEVDRELPLELIIGAAMPKGDRQKVLVEKLTELGVTVLQPLVTERSVVDLKPAAIQKLRRLVIEASKQCGRNRLMEIREPINLAEYLEATQAERCWIAHPTADPAAEFEGANSTAIAIGPEGGFTDGELQTAADRNWYPISFGLRTLRIETAAVVAAARASCAPAR